MSDYAFLTEILTEVDLAKEDYSVAVLILSPEQNDFLLQHDIMGASAGSILHHACKDYDVYDVQFSGEVDYVKIATPFVDKADYLVLLHEDTPLITSSTLSDAVDYATSKNLDYCFLHRGVILKSSSVKESHFELSAKADFLNKEDFLRVHDFLSLSKIREIMAQRIIFSHISNGVEIVSPANVYIDYNVSIASGVTIMPFNSIRGDSKIGAGSVLLEHNTIINSVVGENCEISASIIRDAEVKNNTKMCLEVLMGDKQ